MIKKKKWVELDGYSETRIDGKRLAADIQVAIDKLEAEKFQIVEITPVLSGSYKYVPYGSGGPGNPTCASWGYSLTEGVIVTAKRDT